MNIKQIKAREVLDSRGHPTVEAEVSVSNGLSAIAMVPSGASTGAKEALELRDGDEQRYQGRGVLKAVDHIEHIIAPKLVGFDVADQSGVDHILCALDGTQHKEKLGANALLAVSVAVAKACALVQDQPLFASLCAAEHYLLPRPMINIINGGAHADNKLDVQEFMIVPLSGDSFAQNLQIAVGVFHQLKQILKKGGFSTGVGDEGGFSPQLSSTDAAIEYILRAIEQAGLTVGQDVALALDVASSELYEDGYYYLHGEQQKFSSDEFISYLSGLVRQYPIISIEDGCAEHDWSGWAQLTQTLGRSCQLVGDDLFVTQGPCLAQGFEHQAANAILIKPNQVGTLTETLQTIAQAKQHQYHTVVSHRSGDTEDTFIADLAVATSSGQIKTGSVCRSERVAKYNQLIRIEQKFPHLVRYPRHIDERSPD